MKEAEGNKICQRPNGPVGLEGGPEFLLGTAQPPLACRQKCSKARPLLATAVSGTSSRYNNPTTVTGSGHAQYLNDERYLLWSSLHGLQHSKKEDGGQGRKHQLINQELADYSSTTGWPLWHDICLQKLQI
jgi:hypothetical protein